MQHTAKKSAPRPRKNICKGCDPGFNCKSCDRAVDLRGARKREDRRSIQDGLQETLWQEESPCCSLHNLSLGNLDAIEWLRGLPSGSIDLVVTDPPYESLEKHRAVGTTTRLKHSKASSNDWFNIFPNSRFEELCSEVFRVLRNNRHFYCFCDQETMFVLKPIAEAAGFKFWKPIVWDKMKIGMGYHYRARYELILFFEKGKRKLNNLGIPDVLQVPRVFRGYPTEKPVTVSETLISQSTNPDEWVIDPFMGSGSVGAAAVCAGRRFLGNDSCMEAVEIARRRIKGS